MSCSNRGDTPSKGDPHAPGTGRAAGERRGAASHAGDPSAAPAATAGSAEDGDEIAHNDSSDRPTHTTPTQGGAVEANGVAYHLDDAEVDYKPPQRSPRPHKARSIEIILRSTPPGAVAAVDGVAVGPTPALWQGNADGRPRDFTFVLPGYAIARYRFIPIKSGVVHASLDRLKELPDAGTATAHAGGGSGTGRARH